jgi:hypothetical protein
MVKPEVTIAIEDPERGLSQSEIYKKHNDGPPPREYRDQKVKPKLKHRPWLKILDEFLDPTEECFKNSQERRLLHFDVQVIHISVSGEVSLPINCNGMKEFKDATSPSDNKRCGTILITEDISLTMIDALGIKYELEPDFFACHLEGTEAFRTGRWHSPEDRLLARGPNILGDYLRKAPFYTAEYRRPYHIKGGFKESADLRSRVTSTPRGVEVLNDIIPDVFASEKISVYKKKGDNTGRWDRSTWRKIFMSERELMFRAYV